jgi:hypothetical protein
MEVKNMIMFNKMKLKYMASLIIVCLCMAGVFAWGAAEVKTTLISGDPKLASEDLVILVEVLNNDTGSTPIACAFRVNYNSDFLSYKSVTEKDMGQIPFVGAREGTSPNVYRDISTLGDASDTSLNKECFEITLTTTGIPTQTHSVIIEDDPDSSAPLTSVDFVSNVPHTFNNSGTTAFETPVPTPTPTPTPTSTPSKVMDWKTFK